MGTKDAVHNEHLCDAKKEGFSILSCTEEINYVCIDDPTLSRRPFLDSVNVARSSPSGFFFLTLLLPVPQSTKEKEPYGPDGDEVPDIRTVVQVA